MASPQTCTAIQPNTMLKLKRHFDRPRHESYTPNHGNSTMANAISNATNAPSKIDRPGRGTNASEANDAPNAINITSSRRANMLSTSAKFRPAG